MTSPERSAIPHAFVADGERCDHAPRQREMGLFAAVAALVTAGWPTNRLGGSDTGMKSDAILSGAPGPTPWWVPEPPLVGDRPEYSWQRAGDDAASGGKTVLVNADGRRVLLADYYCWIRWFGTTHLLLWHQQRHASSTEKPLLRMHVFAVSELSPLPDDACRRLDACSDLVLSQGGHVAAASFDAQLDPGRHSIQLPFPYSELDELLVLVDPGRPYSLLHLWILQPSQGVVDVIPQEWFNREEFDIGYEWVTRMARDPQRRLVGEGIRLGVFMLDQDGRRIEKWLCRDPGWPFWYLAQG